MPGLRQSCFCFFIFLLYVVKCQDSNEFVPAGPGETPSCAAPGETYCETIEGYPTNTILYLLTVSGVSQEDIYVNESMDGLLTETFTTINPAIEGVPPQTENWHTALARVNFGKFVPKVVDPSTGGEDSFRSKFKEPFGFSPSFGPGHFSPPETWWTRFARPSVPYRKRTKRQATNPNQLCPTQGAFVTPKTALNNKGNWMYTVNVNEVDTRFTQLVRAEKCVTQRCSSLCAFPPGYFANCQQQFVQKKLVALEGTGRKLYTDMFWFPHCCVCQVKRI